MNVKSDQNKKLVAWAERNGWTISTTKGCHLTFNHPRCPRTVFQSATPSDWRAWMRARAMMRQQMRAAGIAEK